MHTFAVLKLKHNKVTKYSAVATPWPDFCLCLHCTSKLQQGVVHLTRAFWSLLISSQSPLYPWQPKKNSRWFCMEASESTQALLLLAPRAVFVDLHSKWKQSFTELFRPLTVLRILVIMSALIFFGVTSACIKLNWQDIAQKGTNMCT